MSLYYQKFERKGNPKNGRYNYYRKGYHYKKNLFNNNFTSYYRSKKLNYDAYEEEISYDRETSYSNNVPSTKMIHFPKVQNQILESKAVQKIVLKSVNPKKMAFQILIYLKMKLNLHFSNPKI